MCLCVSYTAIIYCFFDSVYLSSTVSYVSYYQHVVLPPRCPTARAGQDQSWSLSYGVWPCPAVSTVPTAKVCSIAPRSGSNPPVCSWPVPVSLSIVSVCNAIPRQVLLSTGVAWVLIHVHASPHSYNHALTVASPRLCGLCSRVCCLF